MSAEQAGGTPGPGGMSERMRALLSRAAEEQLLEQRQVSAVLGELRALVEDVDERLATGEQLDRVSAEVRALSALVEARLDAAEARSAALAERVAEATAMVGRAAQELADAVADRVTAQLRELARTSEAAASSAERRLATHVDDAVLALAEVVLRRGRATAAAPAPVERRPPAEPVLADAPSAAVLTDADAQPAETVLADADADADAGAPPADADAGQADAQSADAEPADAGPADAELAGDAPAPRGALDEDLLPGVRALPVVPPAEDVPSGAASARAQLPDGPRAQGELSSGPPAEPAPPPAAPAAAAGGPDHATPEGFVLVPADVAEPDAGLPVPLPDERRTADRRTAGRDDGSGRRRRPWWRPA